MWPGTAGHHGILQHEQRQEHKAEKTIVQTILILVDAKKNIPKPTRDTFKDVQIFFIIIITFKPIC